MAFTYPFKNRPQCPYKGITSRSLIYDTLSQTERNEAMGILPDDAVITIKMPDQCSIRDFQNKFIDPLYHNVYRSEKESNPLLLIISNANNKISLPYFFIS